MIDDLPVPAPRSTIRPVPARRKLSVGNDARPLNFSTNAPTSDAAPDQRVSAASGTTSHLDHLSRSANSNRTSAQTKIAKWP
jgi:hypothetical protein